MSVLNISRKIPLKEKIIEKEELEGSFTVEASFVMPVVVFIVLTLIFLGYSLYDQCRWEEKLQDGFLLANQWILHPSDFSTGKQDLDRINERGVFFRFFNGMERGKEAFEAYVLSAKEDAFITQAELTAADIKLDGVHCEIMMERRIPDILIEFSSVVPQNREELIRLHHPAEFIRGYAVLNEIVEGTKGLSELKEEIGNFINKIPD